MGLRVDRSVFFLFSLFAALLIFSGGTAMADIINGFAELSYSRLRSASTDETGQLTQQTGTSYFQRYRLSFTDQLYPHLQLLASGTFEKTISLTEAPEGDLRSTAVTILPQVSLSFGDPFVSGGAGYSKREEKTDSPGASVTQFLETRNAFLTFRPEGLPLLSLYFTRADRFDKEYERENISTDTFYVHSAYELVKNLNLSYSETWLNTDDKLRDTTSTTDQQNWLASYSDRLFHNRVTFSSDYNHSRTTAESEAGHGSLKLQLFPFVGLSAIASFNVAPPPPTFFGTLNPNGLLINGDLTSSAGINIGQSVSPNTNFREVGLDLVNAQTVNTLDIYVALNQPNQDLPASVANTLRWYIYTSADGQTWTLFQSGLQAAFDTFTNQFEITFPTVTTRFIMAAVQPLSLAVIPPPGTDVSNIFITELQAFNAVTSTLLQRTASITSESFDVNIRATITDSPVFFYNMNYSHFKSDPGKTSFDLINSLNLSQQLSRVLWGTASVSREDIGDSSGTSGFSYNYNASLTATPLPTLRHGLTLSGRRNEVNGVTSNSNALYLSNGAQLFRGVDVSLDGGVSRSSSSTGSTNENTTANFAIGLVPNKDLSINANISENSTSSQTGTLSSQNRNQSASVIVSFRPVQTVYLFYQITESTSTGSARQTLQNYSVSWSPLSSGTLQFSLAYFETLQSTGGAEGFDRVKSASISWHITPRALLTASYAINESESSSGLTTDVKGFSTDLTVNF
jgi:hypothetical protein